MLFCYRNLILTGLLLLVIFQGGTAKGGKDTLEKYIKGKVFVQVEDGYGKRIPSLKKLPQHKRNPLPDGIKAIIKEFNVDEIDKPFHLEANGLSDVRTFYFKDTLRTDSLIHSLEKLPYVAFAERVPLYEAIYTPDDMESQQWHLPQINAEQAWNEEQGREEVKVAIVDDAVYKEHEDLEGSLWENTDEIPGNGIDDDNNGYVDDINGYDVADNDNNPSPPNWRSNGEFTHGTHCAGIASANTDNGTGMASVGFNTSIMAVKTKSSSNTGPGLRYTYQGVQYAIASEADVISMSYGGGGYSQIYQNLINTAHQEGITLVAAAGNSNTNMPHYPAAYNHVIGVGATNSNDERAYFSNYGSYIDVMAPGVDIYSTLAGAQDAYGTMSGTSMACPVVSGLSSLMLSHSPGLTPDSLETCLENSCDNIDAENPGYIGQLGAGRVNAFQALSCLQSEPIADFSVEDTLVCVGETVAFKDQSAGVDLSGWQWTFSGGNPANSTQQNPSVTYASTGTYPVTLTVTNPYGSDTKTKTQYIHVERPEAELSGGTTIPPGGSAFLRVDFTGPAPRNISYTDGAQTYTEANITSNPYYFSVSPDETTTYTLTGVTAPCSGTANGSAEVVVDGSGGSEGPCSKITVSHHQKVSDSQGNFSAVIDGNDRMFGVSPIGDLDGDGVTDLAVGAYNDQNGGDIEAGAVYILFMNADGTVDTHQKISQDSGNFSGDLHYDHKFGADVAGIGDVNGDGNPDIAVGVPGDDESAERAGAVFVLLLNSDGTVSSHTEIYENNAGFPYTLDYTDNLGWEVNSIGDYNGDGVPDFAVSSTKDDDGVTDAGAGYLVYLNTDGTVNDADKLSATQGGFNGTIETGDAFGRTDVIGDVNGDGVEDLVVGAKGDDDGGTDRGAVWILFMNQDGTVSSHQKISSTEGNFGGTLRDTAYFGVSVSDVGDINQDGIPDIVVGADGDDDGGSNRGAAWLIYLNNNGTVKGEQKISQEAGNLNANLSNAAEFGTCVESGDLNQDGVNELFVGAPNDDDGHTDAGAFYTLFLNKECQGSEDSCVVTLNNEHKISDTAGNFTASLSNGDLLGHSVTNLGDIDGDGVNDLAVGSQHGPLWVLFMNADGTVRDHQAIGSNQGGFNVTLDGDDGFAHGLAGIGDLNNDGVNDLAVGQIKDDQAGGNAGAAWILFLNSDGTVNDYQKITDGVGGFSGNEAGDRMGCRVASISDLNGDNVDELVVGARNTDDGGTHYGALYIMFMNTDGTVDSSQKISATAGGFNGNLDSDDKFGNGLTSPGDLNGDGVPEIVTGAHLDDDGGTDRGALWVLFLDNDGTVITEQKISSTQGGFSGSLDNGGELGWGVGTISDMNQDGNNELLVSNRHDNDGGNQRGATWIMYLNDDGTVHDQKKISDTQGNFDGTLSDGDKFGQSVSSAGDLDSDGIQELAIGAIHDDDGGSSRGALWILDTESTCDQTSCSGSTVSSTFQKTIGGSDDYDFNGGHHHYNIVNTDSGNLYTGQRGVSGNIYGQIGSINENGELQWHEDYEGQGITRIFSAIKTNDGNYLIVGMDKPSGGSADITAMKTDGNGTILWQQKFGNPGVAYDVKQTADQGFLITAYMKDNGQYKHYPIKVDNNGNVEWTRLFSADSESHRQGKIVQISRHNFIIAGTNVNGGVDDIALYKIDDQGNIGWYKTIGNSGEDSRPQIALTPDSSGIFMAGYTNAGAGSGDIFASRIDTAGNIVWQRAIGGSGKEEIGGVTVNSNGNFVITGFTASYGAGGRDLFLMTLDPQGNVIWSKAYGGSNEDVAVDVTLTNDGGLLALGHTGSFNATNHDLYFVKTDACGNSGCNEMDFVPQVDTTSLTETSYSITTSSAPSPFSSSLTVGNVTLEDTTVCETSRKPCVVEAAFSTSDTMVCIEDTVHFNNQSSNASSYQWYLHESLYSEAEDTSHVFHDPGEYKLILNAAGVNCADQDSLTINVVPDPVLSTSNDTIICNNESVQLNASGADSYNWRPVSGLSCSNCRQPVAFPPSNAETDYIVTGTNASGCSVQDTITVTTTCCVNNQPGPEADFETADSLHCIYDSVDFVNTSLYSNNSTTFEWNFGAAATPSISNSEEPPLVHYDSPGVYEVSLTIRDSCGTDSLTKRVSVYPQPSLPEAYQDTLICSGEVFNFNYSGISDYRYRWKPAFGVSDSSLLNPDMTLPDTSITYKLYVEDERSGCLDTSSFTLNSVAGPVANAGEDTSVAYGEKIQLQGCCGPSENEFVWTPNRQLNNTYIRNPVASPEEDITYQLTVTDSNECSSTDSIQVEVKMGIFIPNMFSPNGDGKNDYFCIYGNGVKELNLQIFNKWGEKVYEAESFEELKQGGWDGMYNGNKQPAGTYVWKIQGQLRNGDPLKYQGKQSGTLLLVR